MDKEQSHLQISDDTLEDIAAVFVDAAPFHPSLSTQGNDLLITLQYICQVMGLHFKHPEITSDMKPETIIQAVSEQSAFRTRQIRLDDTFSKRDHGVLLVFQGEHALPCALIPDSKGEYELWDPKSQTKQKIKAHDCFSLIGYCFYQPFPNEVINRRKIFRFAYNICKRDFWDALKVQLIFSVIGLLIPIATGVIFDHVVPNANKSILLQFTLILFSVMFASIAFKIGQAFSFIRLRYRLNVAVQASIWDRLLRLPIKFYQQYTAGDLANRASGIDEIQKTLTGTALSTLTNSVMAVLLISLLFYYSRILASIVVVFTLILVIATIVMNIIMLRYQRPMAMLGGKISGLTLQLLTNVSKLRVANAHSAAFSLWSKLYLESTRLGYRAGKLSIYFETARNIFNIITMMCIFGAVISLGNKLSFGDFIAFNAATSQFFAIALSIASLINSLIAIIPLYERAQPILEAVDPTPLDAKVLPKIQGEIQLKDVSFRYEESTPLILNGINLKVEPGEFLAIVGPTGSGKSTLLRLILGFEHPLRGDITLDKLPLHSLNLQQVRSHMGVVMQDARMLPGTLFENITASRLLTEEDAWEAAKLAALDADINAMPMQMHTLLMEGGKTFSGGQRQRLMIARAIAGKPDLLIFDEATSAIDNLTANKIHENLDSLKVTRIVCAHRLHTIEKADRIIVMNHGEIVQEGTFKSLSSTPGLFQDLIKAQLTS